MKGAVASCLSSQSTAAYDFCRIKDREEKLEAAGAPPSIVNARVYLSEALTLSDKVQALLVSAFRSDHRDLH